MIFVNLKSETLNDYVNIFSLAIESVLLPLGVMIFIILIKGNLVYKIIYSDFFKGVW